MGIQVEFNPDLCLRSISEFKSGKRKKEECLPEKLEAGAVHEFLKEGQRNYWLHGELPLRETRGNQQLLRALASIRILEATHCLIDGKAYTKGKYKIVEVFGSGEIRFEGFERLK